jgi:hyperosmotically inducible protein
LSQIPSVPDAVPQIPSAPSAIVQIPEAPAAVAHDDTVATRNAGTATASAGEPRCTRNPDVPKASTGAVATNDTVAPVEIAADTSAKPAAEAVTNGVDLVNRATELTTPPSTINPPADDRKVQTNVGLVASDSQITTDVKSEIAVDGLTRDVNIGVSTTDGVVALTGSLASQGAIEHVKVVVGKVKDVRGVDASALVLASISSDGA